MKNNKGFTIVELMVAIAMSGIIIAVVYTLYTIQQKTYSSQDQVVEMQQSIRAATLTILPDLRMAGYDPTKDTSASITAANSTSLSFEKDITDTAGTAAEGDGTLDGPNETVTYSFVAGENSFKRESKTGDGLQPFTENIENVEFLYTLDDGTDSLNPADPSRIRSVTITMLARTRIEDHNYTNNQTYTTASTATWGPYNDGYRRRLHVSRVLCRNMGL
jgi:type IV pilus assembly protein PilW